MKISAVSPGLIARLLLDHLCFKVTELKIMFNDQSLPDTDTTYPSLLSLQFSV